MPLIADTEQRKFSQRRVQPLWVVLGIVAVLGLVVVSRAVPGPAIVHQVTVKNGTAYDLDVYAAAADHDGWTPVGIALAGSEVSVRDVIDHGDEWVFRLSGQGQDGGEVQMTRADLEAAGWVFTVPASVGDHIRATGVPPSPAPRGS